jgi:hypothetical protein
MCFYKWRKKWRWYCIVNGKIFFKVLCKFAPLKRKEEKKIYISLSHICVNVLAQSSEERVVELNN